jgi:hypothetical protein
MIRLIWHRSSFIVSGPTETDRKDLFLLHVSSLSDSLAWGEMWWDDTPKRWEESLGLPAIRKKCQPSICKFDVSSLSKTGILGCQQQEPSQPSLSSPNRDPLEDILTEMHSSPVMYNCWSDCFWVDDEDNYLGYISVFSEDNSLSSLIPMACGKKHQMSSQINFF